MKKLTGLVAATMLAVSISSCAAPVENKPDDSCIKALNVADRIIQINTRALNAIVDGDTATLKQATADIKAVGTQYQQYSQQCRQASKSVEA